MMIPIYIYTPQSNKLKHDIAAEVSVMFSSYMYTSLQRKNSHIHVALSVKVKELLQRVVIPRRREVFGHAVRLCWQCEILHDYKVWRDLSQIRSVTEARHCHFAKTCFLQALTLAMYIISKKWGCRNDWSCKWHSHNPVNAHTSKCSKFNLMFG